MKTEYENLRSILDPFAKKIIYWCAKYDFSFPRSCDIVSKYILYKIKKSHLVKLYDISVVRGHYICDEEDTCESFNADCMLNSCHGCTCDGVYQHTYLVFVNKNTQERFIVDYTHYQFHEDFVDLEDTLLNKKLTKEEIFKEMSKYSTFVGIPEKEKYLATHTVKMEDFSVFGILEEYFEEANSLC